MVVADSMTLGGEGVSMKWAYVSTFYENFEINSDNLIMPTQFICTIYNGIFSLVFLGRRYRGGDDIYMVSFINFNPKQEPFLLWEGLSFSKNKVNRDMLGVYPSTGNVEDLFSLYKTAPFLDTSSNVNGTNDWVILASS
jgi:hypothetical protein